jgi:hypothetical protein
VKLLTAAVSALALVAGSAEATTLRRMGADRQSLTVAEVESAQRTGDLFRVWTVQVLDQRTLGGADYLRMQIEIDCARGQARVLSSTVYTLDAKPLSTVSAPGPWTRLVPGDVTTAVRDWGCGAREPGETTDLPIRDFVVKYRALLARP